MFSFHDRVKLLQKIYQDNENVYVLCYEGSLVDLLKEKNTCFCIRGIRNSVDLEYENINFYINKDLDDNIIEIYFPCPKEYIHISSSLVKNLIRFEKDYSKYIPKEIYEIFNELVENKK